MWLWRRLGETRLEPETNLIFALNSLIEEFLLSSIIFLGSSTAGGWSSVQLWRKEGKKHFYLNFWHYLDLQRGQFYGVFLGCNEKEVWYLKPSNFPHVFRSSMGCRSQWPLVQSTLSWDQAGVARPLCSPVFSAGDHNSKKALCYPQSRGTLRKQPLTSQHIVQKLSKNLLPWD